MKLLRSDIACLGVICLGLAALTTGTAASWAAFPLAGFGNFLVLASVGRAA